MMVLPASSVDALLLYFLLLDSYIGMKFCCQGEAALTFDVCNDFRLCRGKVSRKIHYFGRVTCVQFFFRRSYSLLQSVMRCCVCAI